MYLPSWVPIHTVPAVLPSLRLNTQVFRKQRPRTERMKQQCSQAFCYSLQYCHWPTGGTEQIQRAGAVGGRLNWSRTVLERAGSMTVMLLLKEGPDTSHTEHWQRGTDTEWKLPHVATRALIMVKGQRGWWWERRSEGCYAVMVVAVERVDDVRLLTVPSPEVSAVTAAAQFSWGKQEKWSRVK